MSTKFLSQTIRKLAVGLWLAAISVTSARSAEAWVQRYSNTAGSEDGGARVIIDKAGNVIVTGSSDGGPGFIDFATIKYSGAGVPLWTNRYDGPGHTDDYATDVAAYENGDLVVTGFSEWVDYATIKYSSAGVPLWTNRYGFGTTLDEAYAVALDSEGSVFVTGQSTVDWSTVKYSSAGLPLWTNRYHGPNPGYDWGMDLAVDGDGNVVVTGTSGLATGNFAESATIKYSGAGVPLWTNRYSQPGRQFWAAANGAAVDSDSNVFVVATSGLDISATIKYSAAGVPLWTNSDFGPASSIAVDRDGNVIVAGRQTIKFSGVSGAPFWVNPYMNSSASSMAVDGNGNIAVTGTSDDDVVTIRYSSAGMPLWTNRYNGPANSFDFGNGVAVDGRGNVFVTGRSFGGSSSNDFVTIKYSALAPIPLSYQIVGDTIVLSWNDAAFSLQAAPRVHGSYTNIPGATSPHATSLSGGQRYFRLIGVAE